MDIKINQNEIDFAENCRIIKVHYNQPPHGQFHPFDTRTKESHYISEGGYSYLSDIDSITTKECMQNIQSQISSNKYIRFIYQRLLIINDGIIIWDDTENI